MTSFVSHDYRQSFSFLPQMGNCLAWRVTLHVHRPRASSSPKTLRYLLGACVLIILLYCVFKAKKFFTTGTFFVPPTWTEFRQLSLFQSRASNSYAFSCGSPKSEGVLCSARFQGVGEFCGGISGVEKLALRSCHRNLTSWGDRDEFFLETDLPSA